MDILSYIIGKNSGGGGGEAVLVNKNIDANGTYNASSDDADGYKKVTVNVPNSYAAGDEGKVVSNGALVAQTAHADVTPTTSDQTIDTTTNDSIKIKGDADLVASNIKKDVEIFGVTGSYEGGGGSDATLNGIIERTYSGVLSVTSTKIGKNALRNCSSITLVCAPNCQMLEPEATKEMNALETIDLGNCASIGDMAFQNDSNLQNIIIRRTAGVCQLLSGRVFLYTRFVSGGAGGSIFVPSNLISAYKTASNWATLEGYGVVNWVAIEGSQYENYYADGTPISA